MPAPLSKQRRRARTIEVPKHADADLGAQFFDPNALADLWPTSATSHPDTARRKRKIAKQISVPPLESTSVSTRVKSPSPPISALSQSPQASLHPQQALELAIDDSQLPASNLPVTSVLTTAISSDWTAEDSKAASGCPTPPALVPASAVDRESETPTFPIISLGDYSFASAAGGQPTAETQPASTPKMATLNPSSAYRLTGQRSVTQEQAKEQQNIIEQKLSRANEPSPPYDFVDLIGKGSFGRVYLG